MVRIRIGPLEDRVPYETWEQRVRAGRIPADALVNIPALHGETFVRADTLGAWTPPGADIDARNQVPWLTAALVGLQIRVWWWGTIPDVRRAWLEHGTNEATRFWLGEFWRPLSAAHLHADPLHLFGNLLYLAFACYALERMLGPAQTAVVWLGAAAASAMVSMVAAPWTSSLGASGGVFGLAFAAVMVGILHPRALAGWRLFGFELSPALVAGILAPFAGWSLYQGLSSPQVDNWAHVGGAVAGALLGSLFDPPGHARAPGHGRRASVAVLASLVLLPVLAAAGPWLHPFETPDRANELSRRWWEQPPGAVVPVKKPDPVPSALRWQVPVGWRPRSGALRPVPGFGEEPGAGATRWFGARELRDGADAETILTRLGAQLRADEPAIAVGDVVPFRLADRDGRALRVVLPRTRTVLHVAVITRGQLAVEAAFECDLSVEARLAPLRERLFAAVTWGDPPTLIAAHRAVKADPRSRAARRRLASEQLLVGETTDAVALWRALLAEDPADDEAWSGLVGAVAADPAALTEPHTLFDEALADHGSSAVVSAVASALDALGEADLGRGLIELAWWQRPGDRVLKRARIARGRPADLHPETNQAWALESTRAASPPRLVRRDAAAVQADLGAPIDLAHAAVVAARMSAEDDALVRAAIAAKTAGDDVTAAAALLLVAQGHPPDDPAAAAAGLTEELETLRRGGEVPWLPPHLVPDVLAAFPAAPTPPKGR